MSRFASEERRKIKIDKDSWVEVRAELPLSLKEEYMQSVPKKVEVAKNGNMVIDLQSSTMIPYKFLTKVIVDWSEDAPINVENLKKLRSDILDTILAELNKLYGLNNALGI